MFIFPSPRSIEGASSGRRSRRRSEGRPRGQASSAWAREAPASRPPALRPAAFDGWTCAGDEGGGSRPDGGAESPGRFARPEVRRRGLKKPRGAPRGDAPASQRARPAGAERRRRVAGDRRLSAPRPPRLQAEAGGKAGQSSGASGAARTMELVRTSTNGTSDVNMYPHHNHSVMRGLDPRIHDERRQNRPYGMNRGTASWIAGSSPAMTGRWSRR